MKIVIVGAGIAGLSTYLFLKKHLLDVHPGRHSVKIYEGYDIHNLPSATWATSVPQDGSQPSFTTAPLGAGIAIGNNGLSVLERLPPEVVADMRRRGHPVNKWRLSTARGWELDTPAQSKEDRNLYRVLIVARQAVWEVLRDAVLQADPSVLEIRKVQDISISDAPGVPTTLTFADGSTAEADLLVGADGLRSAVRAAMFADTADTEPYTWLQWATRQPPKKKDYATPQFQGMAGLGGFVPSALLTDAGLVPGTMCLTMGSFGSFGHGYLTSTASESEAPAAGPLAAWWSSFPARTATPYAGADGRVDQDAALKALLQRHRGWHSPAIHAVLDYVAQHGIGHVYPTYMTEELRDWQRAGKVVLVGDAAHTLNPSTGQGACQALEDAETLARVLGRFADGRVAEGMKKFVEIRRPRVQVLYKQSRKVGRAPAWDLGVAAELMIYGVLWYMVKFQTWKELNEFLLGYDLPAEVEKAMKES